MGQRIAGETKTGFFVAFVVPGKDDKKAQTTNDKEGHACTAMLVKMGVLKPQESSPDRRHAFLQAVQKKTQKKSHTPCLHFQ